MPIIKMAHTLPATMNGRSCFKAAGRGSTTHSIVRPDCHVARRVASRAVATATTVVASTTKLPASHLESSKRALEQLKDTSLNSEHRHSRAMYYPLLPMFLCKLVSVSWLCSEV